MTRRCTREGVEWNPGGPCNNGEVDRLDARAFLAERRADRLAALGAADPDPAFVLRVTHLGVLVSLDRRDAPYGAREGSKYQGERRFGASRIGEDVAKWLPTHGRLADPSRAKEFELTVEPAPAGARDDDDDDLL